MRKIKTLFKYLPYIFQSVWFNFRNLPLHQAFRIPILLYKPRRMKCKGTITIDSDKITTGMIKLGGPIVSIYPNTGITFDIMGGVIFKGSCTIGNNSFISVARSGTLTFGDCFYATTSLKIVCYKEITFGPYVLVGWENIICDTDFHSIKVFTTQEKQKGYAPIHIGANNWLAMKCLVLKGTKTPDYTIIGANSVLLKDYSYIQEHCLIAGYPANLLKENVYRDSSDDHINYGE